MTGGGWCSVGGSALCVNSTSPVELLHCLRTKMYAVGGRSYALAQVSCVSRVCFQGVLAANFIYFEILIGVVMGGKKRKSGKCFLCVRQSGDGARRVCVSFFVAALRDANPVHAFSQNTFGERTGVKFKCKRVSMCYQRLQTVFVFLFFLKS